MHSGVYCSTVGQGGQITIPSSKRSKSWRAASFMICQCFEDSPAAITPPLFPSTSCSLSTSVTLGYSKEAPNVREQERRSLLQALAQRNRAVGAPPQDDEIFSTLCGQVAVDQVPAGGVILVSTCILGHRFGPLAC